MFLQVNRCARDVNHPLAVYGAIVGAWPLVTSPTLRSLLFVADVAVERGGAAVEHGMRRALADDLAHLREESRRKPVIGGTGDREIGGDGRGG